MANIIRLQQHNKVEDSTLFPLHTGDVEIITFESGNNSGTKFMIIRAASPTEAHFNTGPSIGSLLIDTTDASGKVKVKTGAATWDVVGAQS